MSSDSGQYGAEMSKNREQMLILNYKNNNDRYPQTHRAFQTYYLINISLQQKRIKFSQLYINDCENTSLLQNVVYQHKAAFLCFWILWN